MIDSGSTKPNRIETKNKDTDKQYHLDYAKYCNNASYTTSHAEWLEKIKINKLFYQNKQWENSEDLQAFLNDSSGKARNRIKMTNNLIRPMVEQYRGNAIILKINAIANNISPGSISRKDQLREEKLFKTEVANEFPVIGERMRASDKTIGGSLSETDGIFENLYVDPYVEQINALLRFVKNLNEFPAKQVKVAQNLALSGLVAMEGHEHGGHLRWNMIESEDFIYDKDSREFDMSDASFMGYKTPMDVSYIAEKYQLSKEDLEAIENYVSLSQVSRMESDTSDSRTFTSNRLLVYSIFWKDTDQYEFAYVRDEFGQPYLTRVNFIYPGEETPRYTDADIIDYPRSVKNNKIFKKSNKAKLYVDYIRFCRFIPSSSIATSTSPDKSSDIVLEYGSLDYQEVDLLDFSNCKFPIKVQTWGFVDGEVFSPVDDAINPQRFINRVLSVTEQLINSSGGTNVVIDEDSIDPNSKDSIYYDIKEGNPITVRTKGKGVPNTVGYYDNTPKQGTYGMFGIIPIIKQMMQDVSGINEGLKGESTGSDQLVGVTQLMIQRGSLMQEPFYEAIARLFMQMYQYTASVGKSIYIDNEIQLVNIVGEKGAEIVKLSKELKNEDFNIFIERENDDSVLKSQANQLLAVLREQGLIDDTIFANLFNRSTPNDVSRAMRNFAKLKIESKRQEAKLMEEQAMQEQMVMGQQQQQQVDLQNKQIDTTAATEDKRINKDMAKALLDAESASQKNIQ
jgi:hypothetical protein